jgi:uncharacterized protein YaeQ
MALTSTMRSFDLDLSDTDRGVYETFALRMAQHPSETDEHVVARLLAYALAFAEDLAFTQGLASSDEPAIEVRDPTGALKLWVDVGLPDAPRLHRASKAAPRVLVFAHKDPTPWLAQLAGQKIHRVEQIEAYALDRGLLTQLAGAMEKRNRWAVSVSGGQVWVTVGNTTHDGTVTRLSLTAT